MATLRTRRSAYTVFVCSDGESAPTSASRVQGQRGLAARVGLGPSDYEVLEVPADDAGAASAAVLCALQRVRARFPDATFIADFTGGTKSMSVAVALAAAEMPEVQLQLTAGERRNLERTEATTSQCVLVSTTGVAAARRRSVALALWQSFAYGEAARLAGSEGRGHCRNADPMTHALLSGLHDVERASAAFAAWDRGDYRSALELLDDVSDEVAAGPYRSMLAVLVDARPTQLAFVAVLWDLWWNAQRRAEAGCPDLALARLGRLFDGMGGWLASLPATSPGLDAAPSDAHVYGVADGEPGWSQAVELHPRGSWVHGATRARGGLEALVEAAAVWRQGQRELPLPSAGHDADRSALNMAVGWFHEHAAPVLREAAGMVRYEHAQLPRSWPPSAIGRALRST